MDLPDLAALRAFEAVARQRSFARAALQLGVARSTLSETLRTLEERLGVRLLNRTTRSVAPTEAGERLLARVRPLLADFAAALDSVNAYRDTPSGRLRLTLPPPMIDLLMKPVTARFLAAHPGIELEVASDSALVDIVAASFDAGFRVGERIDRDMIALRMTLDLAFAVVAAPDYVARRGRPATPADLPGHDCLRVRFASGAIKPWIFEQGGKRLEVAVGGSLIVNDPSLELTAALDGVGVAQTLRWLAAPHLAAGRLVALLEDWLPRPAPIYLYYPSRRQLPAPLQAFVAFLRRERLLAGGRRAGSA